MKKGYQPWSKKEVYHNRFENMELAHQGNVVRGLSEKEAKIMRNQVKIYKPGKEVAHYLKNTKNPDKRGIIGIVEDGVRDGKWDTKDAKKVYHALGIEGSSVSNSLKKAAKEYEQTKKEADEQTTTDKESVIKNEVSNDAVTQERNVNQSGTNEQYPSPEEYFTNREERTP